MLALGCLAFLVGFVLRPAWPVVPVRDKTPTTETVLLTTMPRAIESGLTCLGTGRQTYRLWLPPGDYSIGNRVTVSGVVSPLSESSGASHGAVGVFKVSEARTVARGPEVARVGRSVSESFLGAVRRNLSEGSAAFVAAVCFNDTSGLGDEDWEMFRRTGITHVVSASGFHVIVAAALVLFLVGLAPVSRPVQLAIVVCFLVVYAFGAGFRPPVVRSVVMAGVGSFAYFFRRESDGLSALSLAGIVNVLGDPLVLTDTGFHLSMAAVGGLVMFSPTVESGSRLLEQFWVGVKGSWTAIVSTLPIVGYVFGQVSLISLPMNLVAAPLIGVLVWLSLVGWLVGLVVPPLGGFLLRSLVEPLAVLCRQTTEFGSGFDFAVLNLPWFPLWTVWVCYGLMVLAWRPRKRDP